MKHILLPAVTAIAACATPLLAQKTTDAALESNAAVTYDALVAEYDAAYAAWTAERREVAESDEFRKLREDGDREGAMALLAKVPQLDYASFRARFAAEAEKYAGTDDAVDFLTWIAMYGNDKDAQIAAANKLLDDHIKSSKLITIAENAAYLMRPLGPDDYKDFCQRLSEGATDDLVRAWALYSHAMMMKRGRNVPQDVAKAADAQLAEAEKLADGTILADMIAGPRFQKERLQIGMEVPDIVGEDLDGVPFRLSDYRGKVIVLDFWGDW